MSVSVARAPCEDSGSSTPAANPLSTAYAFECPARIKRPNDGGDDQPAAISPARTSSRNAFIFCGDPRGCEFGQLLHRMLGTTSANGSLLSAICLVKGNVLFLK